MSSDPGSREDPVRRSGDDAARRTDDDRARRGAGPMDGRPDPQPGSPGPQQWGPDPRAPWAPGPRPGSPGAGGWGPQWGHGWAPPQSPEGRSRAETALILGILGVVVLPVLAPFAIWQAREAEKLGVPATAGRVLGWVGTVLLVVMAVFFVLWLAVAGFVLVSGMGG